jgi:uncharacterized metal-binding protein YceD (DUF177 family)
MQKNEKIGAQVNLIKLPTNTPFDFDLDESIDWVREILMELNENATEQSPEAYLNETGLSITGELEKKNKQEINEYLLIKGVIRANYATECIRTLKPMQMDLEVPFKVCFVDEALATTEQFAEIDETYLDNDIFEVYFYTKRTINLKDMIHEQIFLNYDQYPVLDAESKLLGVDAPEA